MDALADGFARVNKELSKPEFTQAARELGSKLGDAISATADAVIWLANNMDKVTMALKAFATIVSVGAFVRFGQAMIAIATPFVRLLGVVSKVGRFFLGLSKLAGP